MPSKALLRPATVVAEASSVQGVSGARLEPAEVLKRRDSFTHGWKDDSQVQWLNGAKIDLVRGQGRLAGERTVTVSRTGTSDAGSSETTVLRARQAVVIATGTDAVVTPALADVRPWTSREATSAQAVPARLAIVGGGVVGCEMAAAWSALGSRVTLISRGGLLDRLPGFAGDLVAAGLRDAGVDVRLNGNVSAAARTDGSVTLTLDDGTAVEADEVLSAVGRKPRTSDLGLDTVGLKSGSWLEVDDTLRVTAAEGGWLYAAGDVNHLALLTHMGKYQARVCGDAIAARAAGREPAIRDLASKNFVPQVVFTIPEVAAVGLTAEQASAAGVRTRVVEYAIGNVAGAALFADGYAGRAQLVVDEDRQVIVGLTLAGPGVGEMIHAATIAVVGEVPLSRLWHAVPSYPTISEVWLRLLETYGL
jgi:dihydrolipoamide dehydrogenase